MKKRFVIYVEVDESKLGTSATGDLDDLLKEEGIHPFRDGVQRFVVKVHGDEVAQMKGDEISIDTTAHEIGHILARSFNMPGAKDDPRVTGEKDRVIKGMGLPNPLPQILYSMNSDYMMREYRAEEEAWRVAEKISETMGAKINPKYRDWALGTYRDSIPGPVGVESK